MISVPVKRPTCLGCEFYKTFQGVIQSQHRNIRVNLGDVYCDHKKKAKKFKRGEKRFAPDWCPKRHNPPIIKVYELTEMGLFFALKQGLNAPKVINRCEYELRYTGKIQKSAWKISQELESGAKPSDAFEVPVTVREVVEIDDGIKPYYFYIGLTQTTSTFF